MADIELLIKIPDHLYKLLKDFPSDSNEGTIENVLMKAVEHGIPLPKGHGRLIDADKIEYWKNNRSDEIGYHFAPKYIIDGVPTIVEAESEE